MPTLRLKLISTTLSGALMGMSGAPLPYYVTYLDPASSFNLSYAVNSVAMPMIGGMTSWIGPVIGAVLLGTIQQLATRSENKAKVAAAEKLAAKLAARNATKPPKKLHRKVGKGGLNIAKASVSVGEEITKLPTQVYDAIKRSI